MTAPLADRIWHAGQTLTADQLPIHAADQGLLYGLGLFETTRTFGHVPWLWDQHLERLCRSAQTLEMDLTDISLPTATDVADYVRSLDSGDLVVRLNVTAGPAGGKPVVWMHARPLAPVKQAIRLQTADFRISRTDPLAEVKCFNYGTRILAHRRALRNSFDDALLFSTDELVLETATANVFFLLDDGWVTPELQGGILPGTVRERVLRLQPVPVKQRAVSLEEIPRVRSAFITNSARGVVAVTQIDSRILKPCPEIDGVVSSLWQ